MGVELNRSAVELREPAFVPDASLPLGEICPEGGGHGSVA
jgi:hypothetical protein